MGARKVNWLFKVTQGHHWNWNSTVWLPKPKLFSLHVRWQKIEPHLLYSNAKPMADINNQFHNSLWTRETQNPCQSWPLSSHHQSERACKMRLMCNFCGLPHCLMKLPKQLQRTGGVKNKMRFYKSENLPDYIKCSLCCYIFIQNKFDRFKICSSKIIIDD